MLPFKNRLYKEQEINKLLKEGHTFFLPEFVIKYNFNKQETKIGFIISTKVDKKAVKRNLLRRRLRGVIKELLPKLKKGYYLLIIAKKTSLNLDFLSIKKKLIFAFSKIKIYNE
tara:strand:+ start:1530 stop:1871 length:342 start_codon:yes stop_codon:yes gene_type:complete